MTASPTVSLGRAWRLLSGSRAAWTPVLTIGAPLAAGWALLLASLASKALWLDLTEVERHRFLTIWLALAVALTLARLVYEAGGLAVADRLLRTERADAGDWWDGAWRLTLPLGALGLLTLGGQLLLALLALSILGRLTVVPMAGRWPWAAGLAARVLALVVVGDVWRRAVYQARAALVAEGADPLTALARSAAFVGRHWWACAGASLLAALARGLALTPCWLVLLTLAAILGNLATAALGFGQNAPIAALATLYHHGAAILALGGVASALPLALCRAWLSFAGLAQYRAAGGPRGLPELATRGARARRRRQPRTTMVDGLTVAGGPSGEVWRPARVAGAVPVRPLGADEPCL
jgi:hypothetical protein